VIKVFWCEMNLFISRYDEPGNNAKMALPEKAIKNDGLGSWKGIKGFGTRGERLGATKRNVRSGLLTRMKNT